MEEPPRSFAGWIDEAFSELPGVLTDGTIGWEWHDEIRPGGTGEKDPEIFDPDRRVIHLYRPRHPTEQVVKRAVAFSLVRAKDAEEGWSRTDAWREQNAWRGLLSSWLAPLPHAANQGEQSFADERGRASPAADLASFAAHFFFPAQGEDVSCRLLSQTTLFAEVVDLEPPRCSSFERWARIDSIDSVEIALAAPSARAIGSVFGHLLMRVVYVDENGETPPVDSKIIAFLADTTGEIDDDPLHPIRGIFGGYRARLMEKSFAEVYRDYVVLEGRDISRWRVNLDHEEIRRLMERIWTLEQSGAFAYRFFSQNCATLLVDLFNSVLPTERHVVVGGSVGKAPSLVLDGFTYARASDGGPLVTHLPSPFASMATEAAGAAERRNRMEPELVRSAAGVRPVIARLSSDDPAVRAEVYAELPEIGAPPALVSRYLTESLELETYLAAERNRLREEETYLHRREERGELLEALEGSIPLELADPRLVTLFEAAVEMIGAGEARERHLGYAAMLDFVRACARTRRQTPDRDRGRRRHLRQIEDAARLYALVAAEQATDPTYRTLPEVHRALFLPERDKSLGEQRYVGSFRRLVEYPYVTDVSPAVLAAAEARRALVEAGHHPSRAPQVRLEEDYERGNPHTAFDGFALRGAALMDGRRAAPGLVVSGALYDESLGDRRRHGFSDVAVTILATDTVWSVEEGRPVVKRSHTRVFGYRTLGAFDGGPLLSLFGWEVLADLQTARVKKTATRGEIRGGLFLPIWSDNGLADHVMLRAGVSAAGYLRPETADLAGVGIPLGVEIRKALAPERSLTHFVSFEIGASPLIEPWSANAPVYLRAFGLGRLQVMLVDGVPLPWRGAAAISFEATVRAQHSTVPDIGGLGGTTLTVDAGLRID